MGGGHLAGLMSQLGVVGRPSFLEEPRRPNPTQCGDPSVQLDYEINPTEHDDNLVTLTCHKLTQRATSQPFPRALIAQTLAEALDQRSVFPRTLDHYDIRFTNTHVRLARDSQIMAEFPIAWAATIIAMARGTEGDLFAK